MRVCRSSGGRCPARPAGGAQALEMRTPKAPAVSRAQGRRLRTPAFRQTPQNASRNAPRAPAPLWGPPRPRGAASLEGMREFHGSAETEKLQTL